MKNVIFKSEILLPADGSDYQKWSVVACDQFTSEIEYWQKAQQLVGETSSTLNIILPEVYLEDNNVSDRIAQIHSNMHTYKQNILTKKVNGFIYVERETDRGVPRQGLVAAIDLEDYSFEKEKLPLIRPSENTVVERIPPRLAVRRGACLESPHIMMLIDDDQNKIIEPLALQTANFEKCYDTSLMQGGGKITGWAITDNAIVENLQKSFADIASSENFDEKYPQAKGKPSISMAVGDGNHSLATAKAYWNEIKEGLSDTEQANHPARFCLVEIVNIHSPSIDIEPIHRVAIGISTELFFEKAEQFYTQNNAIVQPNGEHTFKIITKDKTETLSIKNPKWAIATATIEAFLDYLVKTEEGVKIDYLHGETIVKNLAQNGAVGIILPEFKKSDLFRGVVLGGVLPRKTFSMGHAEEKRYYIECRALEK